MSLEEVGRRERDNKGMDMALCVAEDFELILKQKLKTKLV